MTAAAASDTDPDVQVAASLIIIGVPALFIAFCAAYLILDLHFVRRGEYGNAALLTAAFLYANHRISRTIDERSGAPR